MRKPPILLTDDIVSRPSFRAGLEPPLGRSSAPRLGALAPRRLNAGAYKEIKHQPPCFVSSFCKTYGTNYLDNGDIITTKGSGTFESSGIHRWRTQADVTRSDGGTIHTEGEMELAGRTWKGKVFEK